jgi:hypothetical protein
MNTQALKTKALVHVILLHLGAALALAGLLRSGLLSEDPVAFGCLLAGIGLMYGAFLYAVLSIWIPLRPWVARYQKTRNWQEWILNELPTIMALVPVILSALKLFQACWNELRTQQQSGDLNMQSLASVAQKFAREAEALSRDPSVENAKSRLRDL